MIQRIIISIIVIVVAIALIVLVVIGRTPKQIYAMHINSSQFEQGETLPEKYTCEGEGVSPHLAFADIPDGAKSLALVVHDPDVPTNLRPDGNFDHWLLWNLDPDTREIREGEEPSAIFGMNTRGTTTFVPACPPDREHRYVFTLYALDIMLDLEDGSNRQELEEKMKDHIIERAELIGRYNKKENR